MINLVTPQRERSIEMGTQFPSGNSNSSMEAFFEQVRELEKQMDKLSQLLQKLQDANEESKAVNKASTMKAIKQRMAKDIDEVRKIARRIKTKLDEIDKDNAANRQKPGCGEGSGVDRSRVAMTKCGTITFGPHTLNKLKERMTDFQILRKNIQDEYRAVVERRVFTVTGNRPDDETIDQLIETGNSEQIFHASREKGRGLVLDTVEEIQERHDAVKEIEKKLLDLNQVFLDMAVLVEAQGDLVDNIEIQVKKAVDHIQSGTTALATEKRKDHIQSEATALTTTKKLEKKSRKCVMIAIIILLIIAIFVVLLSTVKQWPKGKN